MKTNRLPTRIVYPILSLLLSGLMLTSFVVGSAQGMAAAPWQSKVDPWALETSRAGATEFILFLSEQADLSEAARLPTRLEKGRFVYERLTETADRTQAPLLAALENLRNTSQPALEYRRFWVANAIWVRADAGALQMLARRRDVAHVFANPSVQLDLPEQTAQPLAPSAPEGVEWNVQKINAPQAWSAGFRGQGVVIAGQDTGYAWAHPALKNQYRGWNGASADHNYNWHDAIHSGGGVCGPNSPVPCDDQYHGTHTMGTMVGDDGGANQIGVAPGARWIGCRNMDRGIGSPATYMECFQWFIAPTDLNNQFPRPDLAPDVINNSWSCPPEEGCTDPNMLKTTVENVRAAGIVTVQSAGNNGPECSTVSSPAAIYEASFTVGATDMSDFIISFSNRGPVTVDGSNRLKPDVSAPGQNVRSSEPPNSYRFLSGTSMAAPHVAGAVALLISAAPWLAGHPDEIEALISHNAVPRTTDQFCGTSGNAVPNNIYGWGRIDAWQAIQGTDRVLELSKRPNLPFYQPGWVITFTLQTTYKHPLYPTYDLRITDVIPAHTQFVTATLPYTLTGDTIVWGQPSFGPNATRQVKLVVLASDSYTGTITNQGYSASSSDLPAVFGPPVSVFWAKTFNFLPLVGR